MAVAPKVLIKELGGRFSKQLEIDTASPDPQALFAWFLTAVLFGAPIGETTVLRTSRRFAEAGVLSAQKVLATGWDGLVRLLDEGGYVRYDFKTATKLLEICGAFQREYGGDLNRLHASATDPNDLETRLRALGKGIGPVTAQIFLRELRGFWGHAGASLSPLALLAANRLGLTQAQEAEAALKDLQRIWRRRLGSGAAFSDFETALLRLGKNFCRKGRCSACPVAGNCSEPVAPQ